MKKVALVFVIAVLVPSLVLAWLSVRSLRDQQFLLERQQSLLCQQVTDALAVNLASQLSQQEQQFASVVEKLVAGGNAQRVGGQFDELVRREWPLAEVGFCVTLTGKILAPSPNARNEAQMFYLDNRAFLGNRELAEVYNNANTFANNFTRNSFNPATIQNSLPSDGEIAAAAPAARDQEKQEPMAAAKKLQSGQTVFTDTLQAQKAAGNANYSQSLSGTRAQTRKITPQNVRQEIAKDAAAEDANYSKVVPAEAEFRQLVGDGTDGMIARFLQNKLKLMFWHRAATAPDLIFGTQLNLNRVADSLRSQVQPSPELHEEICLVLLDDNARPLVVSRPGFQANWKRPFVATEIGEALPHWEVAAYLINPAQFTQAARTVKFSLGLLVAILMLTIGIGGWLIVRNLNAELKLARQKTDFVSNVSHELKTPLTSIRMFSELLAEGRITDSTKQQSYLNIITTEAARLTRLINNVLDFSRMERGEKKYRMVDCDLAETIRSTEDAFRPHLEATGFTFKCELPDQTIHLNADPDALSQILVNLMSNAEKYAADGKEITLQVLVQPSPNSAVEIRVLDRGAGIPKGCGEKIFEKFYRAHDSLNSGVPGSGLGLTIARQIARAHGGDVTYATREGGGSCFTLRLPLAS
jgi:signal transduction histidine kinase